MQSPVIKLIFILLTISAGITSIYAQTETTVNEEQTNAEKLCRKIPISEALTYNFRELPKATPDDGAPYGKPPWFQRLFPFLTKKKRVDDILVIEKELGRPIPSGESNRSKEIRLTAEAKLLELQKEGEENWQTWLKENLSASDDEKQKAEIRLRFQGLAAVDLPRFDWREHGLEVGDAGFQGFSCNSCWAFAAVDAMQISRQLIALRGGFEFQKKPRASVQQLVSCMVKKKEDFCKINWHGEAFTFLVDRGLPLGGPTLYRARDAKTWVCDSDVFDKALTWDFVSEDPRKISSNDEIKRALILYGSVVSMIRFDKCLWLYGGGTFNGENFNEGTHFVVIIGWDDAKGAWLVKNSYGKDWGENGFGWIKYGSNNIGESSAWILADPKEEKRILNEIGQK